MVAAIHTMTTSAYPVLTEFENAFKTLVWTPLIKTGEAALEGAVPFLGFPIIKQLDEAVLNAVADALFYQLITFIDVTAIRLVNTELQSKWALASESLALIAKEQGANSDAYKNALSVAAADFASWVHTGP